MLFAPGQLKVEPIPGEPYRYHVESSQKDQPPYIVDLEARWPLGRCACDNYSCQRWPEYRKTLYPVRCKHLTEALIYHALRHIRTTSRNLNNNDGE